MSNHPKISRKEINSRFITKEHAYKGGWRDRNKILLRTMAQLESDKLELIKALSGSLYAAKSYDRGRLDHILKPAEVILKKHTS